LLEDRLCAGYDRVTINEKIPNNSGMERINMNKPKEDSAVASEKDRLQVCAARAQETDQLANEAEAAVSRLRKEFKAARKAYRQAKKNAKESAKNAEKARAKLSTCLDEAFRDLAVARQHIKPSPAGMQPDKSIAEKPEPARQTNHSEQAAESRHSLAA
jgi:hypothetical protein